LQQLYIEAKSQLEYYKEDFKRQGELTVEDAASIKKMQQAKTSYEQIESKASSLEKQLIYLGINPEKISENGFTSRIYIYSPCTGIISKNNLLIGLYIKPEDSLMEINKDNKPQFVLKLDISQSLKVNIGDSIVFRIHHYSDSTFAGTITAISQQVNEKENSVDVTAVTVLNNPVFKPGLQITANIFIQ
jgi:cobalt-zinc-cadmium efflux system membrane fusion protein